MTLRLIETTYSSHPSCTNYPVTSPSARALLPIVPMSLKSWRIRSLGDKLQSFAADPETLDVIERLVDQLAIDFGLVYAEEGQTDTTRNGNL